MRARLTFPVAAFALAVVAAGAVALAADAPERRPQDGSSTESCRLGQAPGPPYGERPPEGSLRYRRPPIVIGCGRLPSGRDFELVGYRLGRGKRGSLCLDVHYPQSGESSGCGSDRVRGGGAIDATGVSRAAGRPATVTGATRGFVNRVTLRYELRGRMRESRAALVIVRGRDLLRAIGVEKPFGAYLGEVPPNSRAVSAQARDAKGHVVGVGYVEGFGGPIGEGRICHGRPRVSNLRLTAPARVGQPNAVSFIAQYPGGIIGSAEIRVNRTLVNASLARRDGARRTITLPVPLDRRGTVGIDVTVEGIPRAFRRCGKDGRLRKSTPKTLVARVR